jgi:exopolyphosphatase/guanosine-5'-triphosphate,3'-diphosphate pyrophosphatase
MRGAIIDVGSYTFHAVVADVDEYGLRRTVLDRKSYKRSAAALGELIEKALARSPSELRVIVTAGDAAFVDDVCARHGVDAEYVGGSEQARLSWLGVSSELAGSHGELAVVELGGGSLILATGTDDVTFATSLPLGVLALRGLSSAEVRHRMLQHAAPALAAIRACAPDTIAITSGTARALVRLGRRLGVISDLQRHIGSRTFAELARRLAPLDRATLKKLGVPASRRDTLANGAVAISTLLELLGKPVVYIASSAMREGALVELARRRRSVPLLLAGGMH